MKILIDVEPKEIADLIKELKGQQVCSLSFDISDRNADNLIKKHINTSNINAVSAI